MRSPDISQEQFIQGYMNILREKPGTELLSVVRNLKESAGRRGFNDADVERQIALALRDRGQKTTADKFMEAIKLVNKESSEAESSTEPASIS